MTKLNKYEIAYTTLDVAGKRIKHKGTFNARTEKEARTRLIENSTPGRKLRITAVKRLRGLP